MPPIAAPRPVAHELRCMEIVGGNRSLNETLSCPGLDVWIDSRPHQGHVGGDVYYFSSCGSGRVTRLAVVDVSGHGPSMDGAAQWLRRLMRKHINLLNQERFARALNRELTRYSNANFFATGLLMAYFAPTDHLLICNAGHPRPIWYSTRQKMWIPLHHELEDCGPSLRQSQGRYRLRRLCNLPLGVVEPTDYRQFDVKLDPNDLVVVYTDGLIEAHSQDVKPLNEADLIGILQQLGPMEAAQLGQSLLEQIEQRRGDLAPQDDQTLIVLRHNASNPPPVSVGRAIRLLPRLIGLRRR